MEAWRDEGLWLKCLGRNSTALDELHRKCRTLARALGPRAGYLPDFRRRLAGRRRRKRDPEDEAAFPGIEHLLTVEDLADIFLHHLIMPHPGGPRLAGYDAHRASFEWWLRCELEGFLANDLHKQQRRAAILRDPGVLRFLVEQSGTTEEGAFDWAQTELDALAIRQEIARLPEGERQAIVLHDLEELDYPGVARRLGIRTKAAKKRVLRARAAVRQRLYGAPIVLRGAAEPAGRSGGSSGSRRG